MVPRSQLVRFLHAADIDTDGIDPTDPASARRALSRLYTDAQQEVREDRLSKIANEYEDHGAFAGDHDDPSQGAAVERLVGFGYPRSAAEDIVRAEALAWAEGELERRVEQEAEEWAEAEYARLRDLQSA